MDTLKSEIPLSLKSEIFVVIKSELKNALEDFDFLNGELRAMKTEIINSTTALHADIEHVKTNVKEDKDNGLSTWSDEVVTLQNTVRDLKSRINRTEGAM